MHAFLGGGDGGHDQSQTAMSEETRQLLGSTQLRRDGEGWLARTASGEYYLADDGRMMVGITSAPLSEGAEQALRAHAKRMAALGRSR